MVIPSIVTVTNDPRQGGSGATEGNQEPHQLLWKKSSFFPNKERVEKGGWSGDFKP